MNYRRLILACFLLCGASPAISATSTLVNLSTRGEVGTGDNVLIGGFIISGSENKTIVVRAIGPSLTALNVPGALADPTLEIFSGSTRIHTNDNWQSDSDANLIPANLKPAEARESALIRTLAPGAYTAIIRGANLTSGVALVEVFEVNASTTTRLVNLSTRGRVSTGDNVMIGGFIISGTQPKSVVIRAIGPSLSAAGVAGVLADPQLSIFSGQTEIHSNDNWQSDASSASIPANLRPTQSRESALLRSLAPGAYTAIVRGVSASSGVGLVEVFEVPDAPPSVPPAIFMLLKNL